MVAIQDWTETQASGGPHLYARLADVWIFAQVGECLGVQETMLRRGGERFVAVRDNATSRLRAESPGVAQILEGRDEVEPDLVTKVAAEYMIAECFEEFGDSETAERVRSGGAPELMVAMVTLALDRLARALDGIGGEEFEWEAEEYSGRDTFEDRCERYDNKLRILLTKFYLAEVVERFDAQLADELRSGSREGSDWYWDLDEETAFVLEEVNPEFVARLRHPSWPSYRNLGLPDLVFADELVCVAYYAYTKLSVGDPPNRDLQEAFATACDRLRMELAIVDHAFEEGAPSTELYN